MLAAMMLLVCPALAEEMDVQTEAYAAYAQVLLDGAPYEALETQMPALRECTPARFTVLDMDGDGLPEVVLELADQAGYFVLTCQDGMVYAGFMGCDEMTALKDDGTYLYQYEWITGVAEMLQFQADEENGKLIGWGYYALASARTYDVGAIEYTVDNGAQTTDEAGYNAVLECQKAKLDALWYNYTEENVKLLLGQ